MENKEEITTTTAKEYIDERTIAHVVSMDAQVTPQFDIYKSEVLANYKRVAGHIFSESELAKLTAEERPRFVANLLLPIILQLAGNFKNNESTVEAVPRTPGDYRFAEIITGFLDWLLNHQNKTSKQVLRAYIDALIGRVGWIVTDWAYDKDPEGSVRVKRVDPFRLKWDMNFKEQDLSDCNYIIDAGWYTPEEILNTYCIDKPEMYAYIKEQVDNLLGKNDKKPNQLISWTQRVWGIATKYLGVSQGYDSEPIPNTDTGTYYDSTSGLFYIIELHERKSEIRYILFDPVQNKEFDITEVIGYNNGTYDQEKLAALRSQFYQPVITCRQINQIYQTTVCPALNVKLYDAPYDIQNNQFKYTPIWCFDFGITNLEHKSYVDQMIDPVSSYNLRRNTILTYLMKTAIGEVWAEENTLGEHEEDFLQRRTGGLKYVKPGALTGGRIQRQDIPTFPAAIDRFSEEDKELIKELTGVRDNAMGTSENSNESGRLYQARVKQADLLQLFVQDNAFSSLPLIARNALDLCKKYFPAEKMIKITRDETNPYWLQLNQDYISILTRNGDGRFGVSEQLPNQLFSLDYDIILSPAPFSEAAKAQEFEEIMLINQALSQLNPAYVDPVVLVKAGRLKGSKEAMLSRIALVDSQAQLMQEQLNAEKNMQMKAGIQKQDLDMQKQKIELNNMQNELQLDETIKSYVGL